MEHSRAGFQAIARAASAAAVGLSVLVGLAGAASAQTIAKWRRHVVELPNASYSANPFELEVDATFTHTESGETLTLPGYYAGDDTWRIGFMPTAVGEWSYVTSSSDTDLDGVGGTVECTESGLRGMLEADPVWPKKWHFRDAGFVVPIALRMEFFSEPATLAEFEAAADFLQTNEIHMMETRLTEEYGQFDGRHDFIFAGDWRDHEFDLTIWDRMEERMEALTERGLGAHLMFYSDDAGKPGWSARSDTEALVIRYTVARLAGYPAVLFNTGIDIAEYRTQDDIDWWGAELQRLDPYDHPASSRRGGGSGPHVLATQTFDSHGDQRAEIDVLTERFEDAETPVSMDDAWGENRDTHPQKNHTAEDIRRAFWKATLSGGTGGLVRGGGDGGDRSGFYYLPFVESDLESEQWLRLVNPFVRARLGRAFGAMVPEPSLVSDGYALADPDRTRLLFWTVGENDTYDSGDGGPFTVHLTDLVGAYAAAWFDPRTGEETSVGVLTSGQDHTVTPPSTDDWALLLSAPRLAISGSCPGSVTVELSGAQRRETTAILWALDPGEAELPIGPCAGTQLDLDAPRLLRAVVADDDGTATVTREIQNEGLCGRLLQAVGADACAVSGTGRLP